MYGRFYGDRCLNIGSGFTLEKGPGWTNMDFNPECGCDVVHNMLDFPWPFEDNTFDTIQASHVMEHFFGHDVIRIVYECSRILKLGGHFVIAVPYGTHNNGWANPHHKQLWSEHMIGYLFRSSYEVKEDGVIDSGTGAHHGAQGLQYAEWSIAGLSFTPAKDWLGKPQAEIAEASEKYLNVIQEMQFAMKLEEK
jgi:SAM-dependent methyltransferase